MAAASAALALSGAAGADAAPSTKAQIADKAASIARSADVGQLPSDAYVAGEVLVRFRDDASGAARKQTTSTLVRSGTDARRIVDDLQLIELRAGATVADAVSTLNADEDVLFAQPNYTYKPQWTPTDPSFPSQWALPKIGAPSAWDAARGDPNVPVAVLEGDFDYSHPEFSGQLYGLYDVIGNDSDPGVVRHNGAYNVHGTAVAGIIGARANNGIGVSGVAPDASLVLLGAATWVDNPAITPQGGSYRMTSDGFVGALAHVAYTGTRIVNVSFGGGPYDPAWVTAMTAPDLADTLFVVAAGNENLNLGLPGTNSYPCSYDLANVLCVGASDENDGRAIWNFNRDGSVREASNYDATPNGDVDLFAPGKNNLTVHPAGWGTFAGTSSAAPHVAGAAAVLLGMRPHLTTAQLKSLLTSSATQLPSLSLFVPNGRRLQLSTATAALAADGLYGGGDGPWAAVWANGAWRLRYDLKSGPASLRFSFGNAGQIPLMGDWDGDGIRTPGIWDRSNVYLSNNLPVYGTYAFQFGQAGDIPIVGDWNGDGVDTIGLFRGGRFLLRNSNSGGNPDADFWFGDGASYAPIAGDWNGDGVDTIGMFRSSDSRFLLKNANSAGNPDVDFTFGTPGWEPVVGDWNDDRTDSVGVHGAGTFQLTNTNWYGNADYQFNFGDANGRAVIGG